MSELLSIEDAAERIGRPVATLRFWRATGTDGPRSFRLGGRVVYKAVDIESWVEAAYEADRRDPQPAA